MARYYLAEEVLLLLITFGFLKVQMRQWLPVDLFVVVPSTTLMLYTAFIMSEICRWWPLLELVLALSLCWLLSILKN